jgi:NAD(P)-dependent dehydrogenase (short-subunit alcohol dehydrogenase family)
MEFQDKVVLVTGAAGNLGRAVAEAFAARGARLALLDVRREAIAGDEGERRLHLACDLRDQKSVDAAVAQVMARFGRIDVLCNVAGGFRMGEAVHVTSAQTWDFLMDLNVRSILHTAHAVVPRMLEAGRGKIVNVGAASATKGMARMGAYVASKSAVIRLTETQSAELRERGINVNCILPGVIDTPENRKDMPDADFSRWVSTADLAAVILFLASDASKAVHGAAIPVTGLS